MEKGRLPNLVFISFQNNFCSPLSRVQEGAFSRQVISVLQNLVLQELCLIAINELGGRRIPQNQVEEIPSECWTETAEHGRGWQDPAVCREGILSEIHIAAVKDMGRVQVMDNNLQKQRHWKTCWRTVTSGKWIRLHKLCICLGCCVHLAQGNPQA